MAASYKVKTALKDCENAADNLCRVYTSARYSIMDVKHAEGKYLKALERYRSSCEVRITDCQDEKRCVLSIVKNADLTYREGKKERIFLDDGLYPWNLVTVQFIKGKIHIYTNQNKIDPMHGHMIVRRHNFDVVFFRPYGYDLLKLGQKTA